MRRISIGTVLALVGVGGIPDDLKAWVEAFNMLDEWWSRALLAIVGVVMLTWPQWYPRIPFRMRLHTGHPLVKVWFRCRHPFNAEKRAEAEFSYGWNLEDEE